MGACISLAPDVYREISFNYSQWWCRIFNHCSVLEMKVKAQLSVLE